MKAKSNNNLPLSGIRVADLTWWQAGPQATVLLAGLGAEVIRVESRQRPDIMRRVSTHFREDDPATLNYSPHFYSLNYNKKSLSLNLTRPGSAGIARELVKISDIVVENFAGGVMERLGLGYAALKEVNPGIIMLSVTGMGQTGPEKHYLSYAQTMHAFTGLTSITGYAGGPPRSVGAFWGDHVSAYSASFAVLAALHHRRRTGEGQYIDLSMSEAVISTIPEVFLAYEMKGEVSKPRGNRDELMAPHGCYRCKGEDCWAAIAVRNDMEWQAFGRAAGSPAWAGKRKFARAADRLRYQDELDTFIESWTRDRTAREVVEALQSEGIPSGTSSDLDGLIADPQLRQRGFFIRRRHPKGGYGLQLRAPWKLSDYPHPYQPPPDLGQHSRYVICELLGRTEEEFRKLIDAKVIY
ncbi:MAG: CoA transferase [Dehalococcoidia bacterium]|nr:CoA transferase [Dehalococcoidia bacterium]